MSMILSKAILLATTKHDGQKDKGGMPYILHPLKVMHYLKTDDQELMAIAVLHDIIEDTDVTFQDLRNHGMTDRVVYAIKLLTKNPGQSYEEYIEGIKTNVDALRVKLCDLRHNSDIRRLKGITDKDIKRMVKYNRTFLELEECLKKNFGT